MPLLRFAAFLLLACLPGCWITFWAAPSWMKWGTRFLAGAALSPVLLAAQLYLVRMAGIPFEQAVPLLACLNALALIPLFRNFRELSLPRIGTTLAAVLVLGTTFLALAPQYTNRYAVLYSTHAWMHAAPDYMVANGDMLLEEPALAGVRLAYPWAGYVFQAALSYALDSNPAYSYIWTNLLWVVIFYGLFVALAKELGLRSFHAGLAPVWLFFGANFAGELLHRAPRFLARFGGDFRYATWIWYFISPSQMLFAVGMFLAMLLILVRPSLWTEPVRNLALAVLLLLGIGFVYPVLFPAAVVLLAGRMVVEFIAPDADAPARWRRITILALLAGGTTAVTAAHLLLITRDRVTPALLISTMGPARETFHASTPFGKVLEYLVVMSPLLIALLPVVRRLWAAQRPAVVVLLTGAAGSAVLYALLFLPYFQNEYKFIFTGAASLAIFPAIALEPLMHRLGRKAIPAAVALTLILSAPLFIKMYKYNLFWVNSHGSHVRAVGFNLRLDDSERFAGITDAIRTRTPVPTVIVTEDAGVYLPALTRRELFVSPRSPKAYPGVAIGEDVLLKGVKGYDATLIDSRRAIEDELFRSTDPVIVSGALDRILTLKRPVVVIVDNQVHGALQGWLTRSGRGQMLFQGENLAAWLIRPN